MELNTLYEKVLHTLAKYPETRNSDIVLTIKIWEVYYPGLINNQSVNIRDIFDLPREDHISRIRRKIQNTDRLYPPTDKEIALKRGWLENEWKKALGYYIVDDNQFELSINIFDNIDNVC